MLGIWAQETEVATKEFCRLHASTSGEKFDPNKVRLFTSRHSPYEGYTLIRLEIDPHVLTRRSGRYNLSARSVSYALMRGQGFADSLDLIPLRRDSGHIYLINHILNFQLTEKNCVTYLIFFGHVVWSPPFYFFQELSQLDALCAGLSTADTERIRNSVLAVFPADASGELSISPQIKTYPLLGKAYTFRIPCFYGGDLYAAKCKVSSNGFPEMLDDERLQVEGVFDDETNLSYHPLDETELLSQQIQSAAKQSTRPQVSTLSALQIEMFLQVWILPLFIFQFATIILLGFSGPAVFGYFEKLQESTLFSATSLALGVLGTTVATFRYFLLEVLNYIRKLVPSRWTQIAASAATESKTALKKLGYVFFLGLTLLENGLKTLMSLTLLFYGISQFLPSLLPRHNFGQSVFLVLGNIPGAKYALKPLLKGTAFAPIVLTPLQDIVVSVIVGFLFSTILIGTIVRVVLMARREES